MVSGPTSPLATSSQPSMDAPPRSPAVRRAAHQVFRPTATRRGGGGWEAGAMDDQGGQPYCYLTTTGRVSGRPHTIEIWFALQDRTLYVLSGGGDRSDWVRNLLRHPEVSVRLGRRDAARLPGRLAGGGAGRGGGEGGR